MLLQMLLDRATILGVHFESIKDGARRVSNITVGGITALPRANILVHDVVAVSYIVSLKVAIIPDENVLELLVAVEYY